jgi:hypothetical protein
MALSPSAIVEEFSHDIPVDLEGMARTLGLPIEYDPGLLSNISGKIIRSRRSPSGFRIIINANDPHRRKRFTLAHELAHYVLHRDLIDDVVDNEMYRSTLSGYLERQANSYAAKLLLPSEAIYLCHRRTPSVVTLARLFDVSEEAMRIRLSELNLEP